ncbi:MAG TPA: NTP transferase domain-containing protein [Polyangiaceae bacterium]|nr:NTP transferase domain-containing protein [Polyangiaceae bacterium]
MSGVVVGIFVGGAGTRMGGVAKGTLITPAGDETLLERLTRVSREAIPNATLFLVGNSTAYAVLGLEQIDDQPSEVGPIGGLRGLMLRARSMRVERVLALSCDLPFIDVEVLKALDLPLSRAARVPFVGGRFQPLAATYAPVPTLAAIERVLADGKHALMRVLDELGANLERLEGDAAFARALRDWDTPSDVTR